MIDFHHHHFEVQEEAGLSIRSFHQQEEEAFASWTGPCSIGLHPWYLSAHEEIREGQLNWLTEAANAPKVKLIGECGLDKLRGPDLALQQLAFEHCLHLAEELHKPLVIHCVRAYEELLATHQRVQPTVPWIVHGFNRKPSVLKALIKKGFNVSFGAAILKPGSPAAQSLIETPLGQLFLETDDKLLPIADLYAHAAQLKGILLEDLEAALYHNWKRIIEFT
ncbi:TatD family hydrolase [Haliscomenobacter sp.]|uniref:TatD family hydrolase n=1 Tax=Haliscomenobacter sp. TaxID=2717303 RepID=UPI003364C696